LPADTLESGFDRAAMRDQQLKDAVDRSLTLPVTTPTGVSAELPTPSANTYLGWDSSGTGLENKSLPTGTAVYSSVANTKAGTAASEAVTPDGLAALWQEGGALTAAASIGKPADAGLGGSYTVSGNTGTNSFWTGDKDGDKIWHRYTGTPLLGTSGNLVPPGAASFQVIAGDMILWRWDATSTKWRAYAGMRADGTALVVAAAARPPVPVRQTVLSGPVDSDGQPNFGGSTGSTTVTATGTLTVTAANGEDVNGQIDRVGTITNPSWTGLSTNGTMYLYLDIAANGACTPGATTLAPVYQFGGAYSNTSGQFTFNIQEMVGKVGSGSASAQTYRVFVGEVMVAAAVVSGITWYAIKGRYLSAFTQNLPGASSSQSRSHNLGTKLILDTPQLILECTTTDNGYAVGDQIRIVSTNSGGATPSVEPYITGSNTMAITTGQTVNFQSIPKTGGNITTLTTNSWKYALAIKRGW
jgi:hypothetical protein